MRIEKYEQPLGGGEGSVIYYNLKIGEIYVPLATSKSIRASKEDRNWVSELSFLYDFDNFEDLKEILNDCEDKRLAQYVARELIK